MGDFVRRTFPQEQRSEFPLPDWRAQDEAAWRLRMEKDLMLRASQAENERLSVELQLMAGRSSRFTTPRTRVGSGLKEDGLGDQSFVDWQD